MRSLIRRRVAPNAAVYIVAGLIAVLFIAGASVNDRFSTLSNLLNVHQQSTGPALVALGQTLAVLTGGIDLSVGSLISVAATLTSGLSDATQGGLGVAISAAIALSVVVGLANGLLVLWLRVHPLIVTLGMGAVLQGGILYYANG